MSAQSQRLLIEFIVLSVSCTGPEAVRNGPIYLAIATDMGLLWLHCRVTAIAMSNMLLFFETTASHKVSHINANFAVFYPDHPV